MIRSTYTGVPLYMKAEQINIGILAHVDAGKTTLAEALLFRSGSIRTAGRVDHGDAYLDTDSLEKQRGITIFSKQARLKMADMPVTLVDTPGHVDFSAEMERTLQVLDYALLVISGADGVQGHVLTLWRLLKRYEVPTFIFVNKMDQAGTEAAGIMTQLRDELGGECVPFVNVDRHLKECGGELQLSFGRDDAYDILRAALTDADASFWEDVAVLDDALMERYLDGILPDGNALAQLIRRRKLFPVMFGSALHMTGVDQLIRLLGSMLRFPEYPDAFGARVYKIGRSGRDRLTWLKITGGQIRTRQTIGEEKINQIRIYSGSSAQMVQEARAGEIVAVTGLTDTWAGQGLGAEKQGTAPVLESVLSYAVRLPQGTDIHTALGQLRELEEEIPELQLVWNSEIGQIHARVMGQVQIEILQSLIRERFGMEVSFDEGAVVYRETIDGCFEGVGHFEPLRHYAEVHLIIESLPRGSGLVFMADCPPDTLDANWQNLVLTHLAEKQHAGVLTGSALTDVKITLAAGRAHIKHTEGGDFREATYRAVRQGLMRAKEAGACRLLEPVYAYRLEVPDRCVGRAITDLQTMGGTFEGPESRDGISTLTGRAPVAGMRTYQQSVTAYTAGAGRLILQPDGYELCTASDEAADNAGYQPEADLHNPAGSVFCSHGSGIMVPWNEVEKHMHLPSVLKKAEPSDAETVLLHSSSSGYRVPDNLSYEAGGLLDEELKAIFERTYGSIRQDRGSWNRRRSEGRVRRRDPEEGSQSSRRSGKGTQAKQPCLLVDGYNIIYAWDELRQIGVEGGNMDGARMRLLEILSNYQGFRQMTLIVVFDAWKVPGGQEHDYRYHNIYVVYTKEAETADAYIERTVHEMIGQYEVTVATSDGAEQAIIFGKGARRMAARELLDEITLACRQIQTEYLSRNPGGKQYLFDSLGPDMAALLESIRRGDSDAGVNGGSQ